MLNGHLKDLIDREHLANYIQTKKFVFLNKIILDIVSKFIPHKKVVFDYREPFWINTQIKKSD